jgi:hypothetical protein
MEKSSTTEANKISAGGYMLPEKVTIGCYDYDVQLTDEVLLVDNRKCSGLIDYNKKVIKISNEDMFSEQSREQTLWHEIVHGIINYRAVGYGKEDEETFVDELATGLYLLCKQNGLLPGQK